MENAVDTIQGNLLQTVMSTNPNFGVGICFILIVGEDFYYLNLNVLLDLIIYAESLQEFPEMMHRYLQIKDHVLEVANKLDHLVEIFQEANH